MTIQKGGKGLVGRPLVGGKECKKRRGSRRRGLVLSWRDLGKGKERVLSSWGEKHLNKKKNLESEHMEVVENKGWDRDGIGFPRRKEDEGVFSKNQREKSHWRGDFVLGGEDQGSPLVILDFKIQVIFGGCKPFSHKNSWESPEFTSRRGENRAKPFILYL